MNNPKILVGCPTSFHKRYCLKEYIDRVKNLSYKNYAILIVENSEDNKYYNEIKKYLPVIKGKYFEGAKDRIINSRNILREYVLNKGYDHFLSLEQDVIPPKDVIEKLIKNNKEVVGGVYFKLGDDNKTLLAIAWKQLNEKYARRFKFSEVNNKGLIEVANCGLGCVLISREILEKVKFRYVKRKEPYDDIWFCEDVRKLGIKIYLDTSVVCKHLVKGMDWSKIKEE